LNPAPRAVARLFKRRRGWEKGKGIDTGHRQALF
jgi:hypothetical protein